MNNLGATDNYSVGWNVGPIQGSHVVYSKPCNGNCPLPTTPSIGYGVNSGIIGGSISYQHERDSTCGPSGRSGPRQKRF